MKLPNIAINTFANAVEMAHAFDVIKAGLKYEKLEPSSEFFDRLERIVAENKILADYNGVLVRRLNISDEDIANIYMDGFHKLVSLWDELKSSSTMELVKTPAGNQIDFMSRAVPISNYLPEFGYSVGLLDGNDRVTIFAIPGIAAMNYVIQVKKDHEEYKVDADEAETLCKEFVTEILRMYQEGIDNAFEVYKNGFGNQLTIAPAEDASNDLEYISACARYEFSTNFLNLEPNTKYIGMYQDVYKRIIKGEPVVSYTIPEAEEDADIIAEHQAKEATAATLTEEEASAMLGDASAALGEILTARELAAEASAELEESPTPVEVPGEVAGTVEERQAIGRGLREAVPVTRTIGISEGNTLATKRVERSDPAA